MSQNRQPPYLNEVIVESSEDFLLKKEIQLIDNTISKYMDQANLESRFQMWYQALVLVQKVFTLIYIF